MDSHETPDPNSGHVTPSPADQPAGSEPSAGPVPDLDQPAPTIREWLARNSTVIVLVALGLFGLYRWLGPSGMWTAFLVAVGLGLVIFIHELGHFLVAKWCDVHVETFSIGFGPPLPGCQFKRGETTYMIAVVPLGGYVKMVGENPESEDEESDPRSFKNKKVWQRMLIISAGVFMNIVLGCVCFAIAYSHGVEEQPGTIGVVDGGSPAWQKGMKSGDVIYQIGGIPNPTFEQVRPEVALSDEKPVPLVFGPPDHPGPPTTITPRLGNDGLIPTIGFRPPEALRMPPLQYARHFGKQPGREGSPAAEADFAWGDEIIGMTDPTAQAVTRLPDDPRYKDDPRPDYFEYYRRMKLLAGKPVTFLVKRQGDAPGAPPVEKEVTVRPAYHWTLGLRMKMGHIVALRAPAAGNLDLNARDTKAGNEGDTITDVEVTRPDGKTKVRWVLNKAAPPDPEERVLDPLRLPYDLQKWADEFPVNEKKTVKLWVTGKKGQNEQVRKGPVELVWDDSYRFDQEVPLSGTAALALPGLGIAYQVTTTVEGVDTMSPPVVAHLATDEGQETDEVFQFQKNDVITAVGNGFVKDQKTGEMVPRTKTRFFFWTFIDWGDIKERPNQWASHFWGLQQSMPDGRLLLKVDRGGETKLVRLTAQRDESWPTVNRGIGFFQQTQIRKAEDMGQAVRMGFDKTFTYIRLIYRQLSALVTGKLSPKNMSGPIGIAGTAYAVADTDLNMLILFLGIISVNLAVVNFLPIPILDGGHMVFLIYEALRGKPASQAVYAFANYAGLALIASLMLFVICLDVSRYFF